MAKKTIQVYTPFNFTTEDGTTQRFEKGQHSVDSKVAEHWFVTAHSELLGKASASDDDIDLLAKIDSLNAQLKEKDNTIGELQLSVTDKDAVVADLTAQLEALKQPAQGVTPASEGDSNGKKPKSTDSK